MSEQKITVAERALWKKQVQMLEESLERTEKHATSCIAAAKVYLDLECRSRVQQEIKITYFRRRLA